MATATDNKQADRQAKDMLLYDRMRVRTTSRKGLVCYMHEQALVFIKKGAEGIGNRREIEKAQNLIFQLELALNKDEDASRILADLYAYCYYLLEKTDTQSLVTAKKILETIAGAFNMLAKQKKG